MLRFWLLVLFAVGCGSTPAPPPNTGAVAAPVDALEPEPEIPDMMETQRLADAACPKVVAPYFYRVEKAGKVGFMLGTRHMSIAFEKMPAVVKDEIAKATLIVFETPPETSGKVAPVIDDDVSPDPTVKPKPPASNEPLSKQLGPELWAKYQAIVGEKLAGIVDEAGPAAAAIMMMMLYEYKLALLDVEIEGFASSAKIKTGGLESSAFQDRLLSELLDIRMLKASIKFGSRAELKKESIRDITEYCAGTDNDPGMDARTRKQMRDGGYSDAEIDRLERMLLDDRNDAWMPKLEKLFADNGVVVVVGADHLIGKKGVVAMLAARGFNVTRVKP